jgi:hypothetical protein
MIGYQHAIMKIQLHHQLLLCFLKEEDLQQKFIPQQLTIKWELIQLSLEFAQQLMVIIILLLFIRFHHLQTTLLYEYFIPKQFPKNEFLAYYSHLK